MDAAAPDRDGRGSARPGGGASDGPERPVVAMLGGGNMNGAILAGLLRAAEEAEANGVEAPVALPIRVTSKSAESAARHDDEPRVRALAIERDADANREAVRGADVVLLGVKPYGALDMLAEIREALEPDAVVVSIAAGVGLDALERALPNGARVLRAMPNTPSQLGLGATGLARGGSADDAALERASAVFAAVGEVVEVEEAQIAAVAAASGSAPAYVYLLAETMIDAGRRVGLDAETARALVVATIRGAAEMMATSPDTEPAELRRRVTSPKGTTERSIRVFEEADLGDIVLRAFEANIERSEELAAEFGGTDRADEDRADADGHADGADAADPASPAP